MSKLPITVCFVAGNEAHRIRPALDSVKGWTSEIILAIDDKVTDGTDKIAESYGAKVFSQPWRGHAGHRNFASSHATQPWLLAIDADEVVSERLRDEIIAAFQTHGAKSQPAAYSFPRLSFFCGRWIRHGDWYPDRVRRLWRKDAARWIGDEPHAALEVKGTVGRLRSDLWHFSNESIARQIAKIPAYHLEFVKRRIAAGKSAGYFELVVRPWWKFLRAYIFRLGFLDGWQGFYIARLAAFSTLTRQAMVREAQSSSQLPP